jgi:hypothetical protein
MSIKKWIKTSANLALLVSFLLTFFLDLTGIELHQYLGIAAAGIVLLHLFTHWKWVVKVTTRIFKKTPGRVRLYYLLDWLLFLSIIIITITGVWISTWLKILIPNYMALLSVHILSSITGLLLLVAKLGLHWKYFAALLGTMRVSLRIKSRLALDPSAMKSGPNYSRRDALKTIGLISTMSIFGLLKAVSAYSIPKNNPLPHLEVETEKTDLPSEAFPVDQPIEPTEQPQRGNRRNRKQGAQVDAEQNDTQIASNPDQDLIPEIASPQPQIEQPLENCVIRCSQGCAYPGACRRYIDQNQNQLCDLGECLVL